MSSYIERLSNERDELEARLTKLSDALANNKVYKEEKDILIAQANVMKAYLEILNYRLTKK